MRVHNVCVYIHMLGTQHILTCDVALNRFACHVNVPCNFNTARSFSKKSSTCMVGSFCGCNELTWLFACNQLTYRSRRLSTEAGTHTHTNTQTYIQRCETKVKRNLKFLERDSILDCSAIDILLRAEERANERCVNERVENVKQVCACNNQNRNVHLRTFVLDQKYRPRCKYHHRRQIQMQEHHLRLLRLIKSDFFLSLRIEVKIGISSSQPSLNTIHDAKIRECTELIYICMYMCRKL